MLRFTLFVLCYVFVGCGADQRDPDVDPELATYLGMYLRIAPSDGHLEQLTSLKWGEIDNPAFEGTCKFEEMDIAGKAAHTKRWIIIEPHALDSKLAAIVLHELGHCLHDLKHIPGTRGQIMSPSQINSVQYWDVNLETKAQEMFNQ